MTQPTTEPVVNPDASSTTSASTTSGTLTASPSEPVSTFPLEAEGPAFTTLIKLLASVLVGALIVWGARASRLMDWQVQEPQRFVDLIAQPTAALPRW